MSTTHSNPNVGTAAAVLSDVPVIRHFSFDKKVRSLTLKPAATISVGGAGVTVADGLAIAAGEVVTLQVTGDLYAIAPVATTCKMLTADV